MLNLKLFFIHFIQNNCVLKYQIEICKHYLLFVIHFESVEYFDAEYKRQIWYQIF